MNLIVAAVGGLAVLGVWSFTLRILQGIFLLLNALWRVAYPAVSRMIETGDAVQPALERALELGSTMVGLLAVAVGGGAPAFVPILFGSKWQAAAPVLAWTAAALVVNGAISTAAIGYFYATGRANLPLLAIVFQTITWYACSIPLLASFGALALGIGSFVSSVVDAIFLGAMLRRDGVEVPGHCCVQMALAIVAGSTAWWVATTRSPSILAMVASLATGEAVYIVGLFLIRRRAVTDLLRLGQRAVTRRARPAKTVPQGMMG